ncbi:MAG: hypothetical protein AMXMBFR12_01890 [Candidatus Babeliales bacterium]
MKKIILFTLFASSLQAQVQIPNFELWNKHIEPLYFKMADSPAAAVQGIYTEIRPGKRFTTNVDIAKPMAIGINLGKAPAKGDPVDVYTFGTGKTLYLRFGLPAEKEKFKETIKSLLSRTSIEADGYIFGPQVGPLLGFKRITEQGYPLKNNITKKDIRKETRIYESK